MRNMDLTLHVVGLENPTRLNNKARKTKPNRERRIPQTLPFRIMCPAFSASTSKLDSTDRLMQCSGTRLRGCGIQDMGALVDTIRFWELSTLL